MPHFPPDSLMNAAHTMPPHTLSIVVPFYNEEDNIAPLVKRVHEALDGYENPWELVLVDDGSSDATVERALQSAKEYGPHVRIVELTRNFKQTAAMQAGIARGEIQGAPQGDKGLIVASLVEQRRTEHAPAVGVGGVARCQAVGPFHDFRQPTALKQGRHVLFFALAQRRPCHLGPPGLHACPRLVVAVVFVEILIRCYACLHRVGLPLDHLSNPKPIFLPW